MSDLIKFATPQKCVMRATAVLLMGTVLVGCTASGSGPGISRYEPTYLRLTEERAFAQALRRHYLELATNAFDRGDGARSDFYSLRSLMAAEGKLAHPGQAARSVDTTGEAAAAGERLAILMSGGARTGSPDLAARAQAAYDCWLVEMGSDGDAQIAQSCRFNALNAIAELEGASTGAQYVATATHDAGQTYVIEPGMPSQTISAHGVTIEITTEPVSYAAPQGYVQQSYSQQSYVQHSAAPQPTAYVVAAPSAPSYTMQAAPAPMAVETVPMMRESYAGYSNYESVPAIATEVVPMMSHSTGNAAYDSAPMMQDIGEPANIIPMPMQAMMIEEPAIEFAALEPATDYSAPRQTSVDLGSIPVFDTDPIETMPMVEMTALPEAYDDAASVLIGATSNMAGDSSVFFGFDSDEVTLEAEDVLIDTVEQARLSGATRITLMGFTDSVGNARYNQLLAMRRAQAVRKYLQAALGSDVTFDIMPVGEVQAVQNGGDGVKEALNRKVEVRLGR